MNLQTDELVLMDQSVRVEFPKRALTVGLSSCIGVGILNISRRIGYLCHFAVDMSVLSIIDNAVAEAVDLQDLIVNLSGGSPHGTNNHMTEHDWILLVSRRKNIAEKLLALGIKKKQIQSFLGNEYGHGQQMVVDTSNNLIITY